MLEGRTTRFDFRSYRASQPEIPVGERRDDLGPARFLRRFDSRSISGSNRWTRDNFR